MKKPLLIIFLLWTSTALGQEDWGPCQYVTTPDFPHNSTPSFGRDANHILLTNLLPFRHDLRIVQISLDEPYDFQLFLPESLSVDGYDDVAPFLTHDGEWLYFASNRPGGFGGYDIWATRRVNDSWTVPANVGANVNSPLDETDPSLPADGAELYFTRGDLIPFYYALGHIFRSQSEAGGWGIADSLPAPIYSQHADGSPCISSTGGKLYFISDRDPEEPGPHALLSHRAGDNWSEPEALIGFVNDYWVECEGIEVGAPLAVRVDSSGTKLLAVKMDIFDCWDAIYDVYLCHQVTDVQEVVVMPDMLSLSVYPNPFNSSLSISVSAGDKGVVQIYDLLGRLVQSFVIEPGENSITWDSTGPSGELRASGVYYIMAKSGNMARTRSAVLIK